MSEEIKKLGDLIIELEQALTNAERADKLSEAEINRAVTSLKAATAEIEKASQFKKKRKGD